MKILHYLDCFDFSRGGVAQYVYQVTRAFALSGANVTLAVGENVDIPSDWTDRSGTSVPAVHELSKPPGRHGWLDNTQVNELMQIAAGNDIVHLHGAWGLGNARLADRLVKANIPYIVSIHGMLDDWSVKQKRLKKLFYRMTINRRFLRCAATIHCTADAEMEQVKRNMGRTDARVCNVPYVVPTSSTIGSSSLAYETYNQLMPNAAKLLFLSRLHYKKSPDLLIKAAAKLVRQGYGLQVLMAGPADEDYLAQLKSLTRTEAINENVLWLGMIREPLKSAVLDVADVFVLPTQQENFGIVLVEAMFAGLPIVTTKGTDIYRELKRGGAMIAEHTVDSIADCIQQLLDHPTERKNRGELGRRIAHDWLDEEKIIQAHWDMYQMAIEENTKT